MSATNVVYLVQAGESGPVKIGTTTHQRLSRRMSEGQCWNPEPLILRILLLGDEILEQRLHAALRHLTIGGEWFTPAVLDLIPENLGRLPFDEPAEAAKLAARRLAQLAHPHRPGPDDPAAGVKAEVERHKLAQEAIHRLERLTERPRP